MKTLRWTTFLLAAASAVSACAPVDDESADNTESANAPMPTMDAHAEKFATVSQALLYGCPSAIITNPPTASGWSNATSWRQTWTLNGASSIFGSWWCSYGLPSGYAVFRTSEPGDTPDCFDSASYFQCVHTLGCSGNNGCTTDRTVNVQCPAVQGGAPIGYVQNGVTTIGWPATWYAGIANSTYTLNHTAINGGSPSPGTLGSVYNFKRNGQLECDMSVSPSGGILVIAPQ